MGEDNRARFRTAYVAELGRVRAKFTDLYRTDVPAETVVDRMLAAFDRKSASNDGPALKATCRRLGIKSTYKAIYEYLGIPQ